MCVITAIALISLIIVLIYLLLLSRVRVPISAAIRCLRLCVVPGCVKLPLHRYTTCFLIVWVVYLLCLFYVACNFHLRTRVSYSMSIISSSCVVPIRYRPVSLYCACCVCCLHGVGDLEIGLCWAVSELISILIRCCVRLLTKCFSSFVDYCKSFKLYDRCISCVSSVLKYACGWAGCWVER